QREARNTSISVRRWIAIIARSPAEVAEPHVAVGIDCDAVTGAENAATQQRRPRRPIPAIGWLAIGFKYQVKTTGVRCALDCVIRDPSVPSFIEREIAGASN